MASVSAHIADLCLLITAYAAWCIFIANNAKNQSNYSPISSFAQDFSKSLIIHFRATISAIRDVFTRYAFHATWNKLGTKRKTTPKRHHFYTVFDMKRVWNASNKLGTV